MLLCRNLVCRPPLLLLGLQLAREEGLENARANGRVFLLDFEQRIHHFGAPDHLVVSQMDAEWRRMSRPAGNGSALRNAETPDG